MSRKTSAVLIRKTRFAASRLSIAAVLFGLTGLILMQFPLGLTISGLSLDIETNAGLVQVGGSIFWFGLILGVIPIFQRERR